MGGKDVALARSGLGAVAPERNNNAMPIDPPVFRSCPGGESGRPERHTTNFHQLFLSLIAFTPLQHPCLSVSLLFLP